MKTKAPSFAVKAVTFAAHEAAKGTLALSASLDKFETAVRARALRLIKSGKLTKSQMVPKGIICEVFDLDPKSNFGNGMSQFPQRYGGQKCGKALQYRISKIKKELFPPDSGGKGGGKKPKPRAPSHRAGSQTLDISSTLQGLGITKDPSKESPEGVIAFMRTFGFTNDQIVGAANWIMERRED